MTTKFTTSTNIIRDSGRELNYIPTPNSIRVVNQIVNDFKKGIRSFNIIGSYGTGKSSFLWALQQSLQGKKRFFNINLLQSPKIEIINFVGEYKSITNVLADFFEVNQNKNINENILSEFFNRYHELGKKNPLLILVIDEFGKFLEYASQHQPEKELYFIQQLSEFANNPDHNIIFLTAVHQNFDAYAFALSNAQKQEWTKVKGRFREITFNEPVEQLLFLASEHLKNHQSDKKTEAEIKSSLSIAKKSKAYNINPEYAAEVASKLFPLDLIAANILTLSLQKYGQHERSLFSFLESTDHTGINSFDKKTNPFYNAACVFDYLIFNFYSFINSRYNPDFASWSAIKNSLEATERFFDEDINSYSKILKTIGLLNVTSAAGSDLGKDFLVKYAVICLGIANASNLIDNLENRKVILYRNYSKRFIISEGTDLDISSALIEAGNKVSDIVDVVTLLKREYQLPPVLAKSYSYLNGTPRLFEFKISDFPIQEVPQDEYDGFINLIFNEKLSIAEVKKESAAQKEAIIYGFYQNSKTIRNQLFEIEKTRKVIDENEQDKIAVKELNNILVHQQNLLSHFILNNLYTKKSDLKWIFKGEEIKISSKKEFNKKLSGICSEIYPKTPKFKNELVNKHKISPSIHGAKRFYLRALADNWNKPDLGFEGSKFPPERTIYLTLLKENGIELYSDKINFATQVSKNSSFNHLWNYSMDFLNSAKQNRRTILEFIEPLTKRPFKLKQGLIDFWIASFLFIKKDDYALFGESGYIPYLTDEVLELIIKLPENYELKTFAIEGVKLDIFNSYRIFLNQQSKVKLDNETFIETIKPFLTFYRNLSEYSKTTRRLKKETLAIRDAIANSKDPEKSFFEDFPLALGYSTESLQKSKEKLQSFIIKLQNAIKELRTSYDSLLQRFEDFILEDFIGEKMEFEEYKTKLQNRFKKLKKHLCLPHQKTFVQRLDSELDDKKAWLSSIAQAVIGKSLETIKDEEELFLYDRFKTLILELDSLTNISQADLDEDNEDVLGIEMSSFVDGIQKRLVRLPKTKKKEVAKIEDLIKAKLSKDKSLNIAALANILKDLLQK
ncbi:MAG: hypothetical protein IPG01_12695 [Chitinophagaceae bacterium]|nr:hypothetical protein [Chitinophagaceae bacterium]